jgi:hypothetical protein
MTHSQIFGDVSLPWIWYLIIVILSMLIILSATGYLLWLWIQGRPLREFFIVKLKSFTNKNLAIFEIFGITNNIKLEIAHYEDGDGYRKGENKYIIPKIEIKKGLYNKIKSAILKNEKKDTEISATKNSLLIIPKSKYMINGVRTIPLWDLHPQLHADIIKGLDLLIEKHINTLEQLEDIIDDSIKSEEVFFDNYSYKNWYELYIANKNKYTVNIYTTDLDRFVEKNYDANFRRSIFDQEFIETKNKGKVETYDKYGLIATGVTLLIVLIRVLYITFFK